MPNTIKYRTTLFTTERSGQHVATHVNFAYASNYTRNVCQLPPTIRVELTHLESNTTGIWLGQSWREQNRPRSWVLTSFINLPVPLRVPLGLICGAMFAQLFIAVVRYLAGE